MTDITVTVCLNKFIDYDKRAQRSKIIGRIWRLFYNTIDS